MCACALPHVQVQSISPLPNTPISSVGRTLQRRLPTSCNRNKFMADARICDAEAPLFCDLRFRAKPSSNPLHESACSCG
jgi:hypothetical protein